jgi:SnoaL-like domain
VDENMQAALQELLDQQAILTCLDRYARGLDRKDPELLKSAYHPDAVDHHGALGDHTPDSLVADWLVRDADRTFSQHLLVNSSIDIDGDIAHAETYYQIVVGIRPEAATSAQQPRLTLSGGRYVDRFERRAGEWRIARRVLISEYKAALDPLDRAQHLGWARRDRNDPSYARPLEGPPPGVRLTMANK